MNTNDFFDELRDRDEKNTDFVQGAEHFIRLKKQSGIDKEAGVMNSVRGYLSTKPMLRNAVISGLASGILDAGIGAYSAPKGQKIEAAIGNGIRGTAVGAAGGALLHHLSDKLASERIKTAGMFSNAVKSIDPVMAATMGGGALAGGLLTRHASKPRKELGGRSKAETELETSVAVNSMKPESGFLQKLHNRDVERLHGWSKAFREHPNKASLLGAVTGAVGGYGLGRLSGAALRLRGGK